MSMLPTSACSHCGRINPERARFCGDCGQSLESPRCPSCAHLVAVGCLFCGQCGTPFAKGRPVSIQSFPEEQLRRVTVLFVMLIGLQELVEELDPEAFRDVLEGCFAILSATVEAHGGTIDKYLPDSMLAVFGVPAAHEDDPARAASASLRMVEAMDPFNRRLFERLGFQLDLKIGINTGKVLVGQVGGQTEAITVMGDVVNTASRLQNAAPVGGILIGESTRKGLSTRFQLADLPPLHVKGKAAPLNVSRVLSDRSGRSDLGLDLSHLPLIGREDAFDQLARGWRRLVRPGSRDESSEATPGVWLSLIGDVGMGKARLLKEFQTYVLRDPCQPRVLVARAISISNVGGLEVLRQLIYSLADVRPDDGPSLVRDKVLAIAQQLSGVDAQSGEVVWGQVVARSLARLAGLRAFDPQAESMTQENLASLQQQGLAYLKSLVVHLAVQQPLLLIGYDLQWADPLVLDFFESLVAESAPGLMVLTSIRPHLIERRPHWGEVDSDRLVVRLEPLGLQDTQRLVRKIVGRRVPMPPHTVERLHRFTGGNPYFLTETIRSILESHAELQTADGELNVPDSLEGIVQSRLDRLTFEEALTLRAAAVIGSPFWAGTVAALLGSPRDETLETLRQRGFLLTHDDSVIPDEQEFSFDHALIARVAAGNLLETVRRRYHLVAAEWLATRGADHAVTTLDVMAAHHFEGAEAWSRALPYYIHSGERALASHEGAEALSLLDHAHQLVQDFGLEVTPEGLARLHFKRGEAHRLLSQLEPALSDYLEAARCAEACGARVQAAAAWYRAGLIRLSLKEVAAAVAAADAGDAALEGLSDARVEGTGLLLRADLRVRCGQLSGAEEALRKALAIWRTAGDRWGLAHGLHLLGRLQMRRTQPMAAQRSFREAAVIREGLGDAHGLALSLSNLGTVSEQLGDFQEALGHHNRSLLIHRRMGDRAGIARILVNQAVGYTRCGYFGRALAALEESLALNRALNLEWEAAVCLINLGTLWLRLGCVSDAERYLAEAGHDLEAHGDAEGQAEAMVALAHCRVREGALEAAQQLSVAAFEKACAFPGGDVEAQALELMCTICLEQGDLGGAREFLEELEWNDAAQVTPERQVEATLLRGRLSLEAGKTSAAQLRFKEAAEKAREHDLTPIQFRACQLLEGLHGRVRPDGTDAASASMTRKVLHELMARVEDAALIRILQERVVREAHSV